MRNNKEIVKQINVPSTPNAGTRVPAGKNDADNTDSLHQAPSVARSGSAPSNAGTEQKGACKKAADKQSGKALDNMNQTKAGNAPDADLKY